MARSPPGKGELISGVEYVTGSITDSEAVKKVSSPLSCLLIAFRLRKASMEYSTWLGLSFIVDCPNSRERSTTLTLLEL